MATTKKTAALKKTTPIAAPEITASTTARYDAESLAALCVKVKAEGFVPAKTIYDTFGPEKGTQGIAILYRDLRMFREVRRPWEADGTMVLGYEWADRRFSKSEAKKVPTELQFLIEFTSKLAPRYTDYEPVTVRCRYTTPILGSVPKTTDGKDTLNTFERDRDGNALILGYHQRAMAAKVLPMVGKEASIARRIGWSVIRIGVTEKNLTTARHAVVDEQGNGLGIKHSEQIADGTEFRIRAMVPTSMLSVAEFIEMLRRAGEFVRLSPGRSAGFGDFEVLAAE